MIKKIDFEQALNEELDTPVSQNDEHNLQSEDIVSDLESHTWSDSTNSFKLGKEVKYKAGADLEVVVVKEIQNVDGELTYTFLGKQGIPFNAKEKVLKKRSCKDVSDIPISELEYAASSKGLNEEQCKLLAQPQQLNADQQEYLSWHHRLGHLAKALMKTLIFMGILPRRPKRLFETGTVPICASCMFGEAHRKPWRTKGSKGSIRKEDETEPGHGTSTDQFVSHQPGLVPQLSGKLTNQRITGATVYVDHVTDFLYVHLM